MPAPRSVGLVEPGQAPRFVGRDETLAIGCLPGFALELESLFAF